MRRVFNDALVSAGALLIVLIALMVVDGRVRQQVTRVMSAAAPGTVAGAGGHMRQFAGIVMTAARDQSIEHAPIVIFVVAATVLVLFTLRL